MSERHTSPALRTLPPEKIHVVPLLGIEANIYNRLWHTILEGKLKPGMKLREEIIGEVFGVSRTIVRKVLFIMEQEGSLTLPHNRGAFVATPKPEDTASVFEALGMAMRHIIKALSEPSVSLTKNQQKLLDVHMKAQEVADNSGDLVVSRMLGSDFLVLLAVLHDNPIITDLVSKMQIRQSLIMASYGSYVLSINSRSQFQHDLVTALLNHRRKEALQIFSQRHTEHERSIRLNTHSEEVDLATILKKPHETFS